MTTKVRHRQANGRPNRVTIHLTDDEMSRWRDLAASDDITLPRWIVESVEQKPPTMLRRALMGEIVGTRMEIRGAMANLNQLAHRANLGDLDLDGWAETVDRIGRLEALLDRLVEQLS